MAAHTDCETSRCYELPAGCVTVDRLSEAESPPKRSTRTPHGRIWQILAVLSANVIGVSFGTVVGWSTAVAPTINSSFSPEVASWVVTITIPVSVIGCLLWGPVTMRFGPRKSLLACGLPMVTGWILLLDSTTLWSVLAGRSLCGFATGTTIAVLPVYVSEVTEDSLRGRLGSLTLLSINLGILVAYSLGGFLDSLGVAIFCGAIPLVFMVLFFPCPESPIFLFANGQDTAGVETLQKLREPGEKLNSELAGIRAAGKAADSSEPKIGDLVRSRAARRATIISLGALSCQQGCGISPVMYYAGQIFLSAGGNMSPIAASCIVGAVQLAGSFMAVGLMDKAGRRTLMIFSCVVMGISQVALGYAMMPATLAPSWLPVVSLSVYILAYALGAGPAPFVIVSEVSAPRVKALACSVAIAYNCALSFVITKIFPDLSYYLGDHGVFWLFAAGCAAGAVFCWFVLPETAGRSSASIQAELEGKKDANPEA